MELLKYAIEFSKEGEDKLIRILLFLYQTLLTILLSLRIGDFFGFVYSKKPFSFDLMLDFITSYNILPAIFIFLFVIGSTKYLVRLLTFLFGWLFGSLISKWINKNRAVALEKFNIIKIELVEDKKYFKKGKWFSTIKNLIQELRDEKNIVLRFCDFFLTILITTILVASSINSLSIFGECIRITILITLWTATIYWFINVSFLKGLRLLGNSFITYLNRIDDNDGKQI